MTTAVEEIFEKGVELDDVGRFSTAGLTRTISNQTGMANALIREAITVVERDRRPFVDSDHTVESELDGGREYLRQIPLD